MLKIAVPSLEVSKHFWAGGHAPTPPTTGSSLWRSLHSLPLENLQMNAKTFPETLATCLFSEHTFAKLKLTLVRNLIYPKPQVPDWEIPSLSFMAPDKIDFSNLFFSIFERVIFENPAIWLVPRAGGFFLFWPRSRPRKKGLFLRTFPRLRT